MFVLAVSIVWHILAGDDTIAFLHIAQLLFRANQVSMQSIQKAVYMSLDISGCGAKMFVTNLCGKHGHTEDLEPLQRPQSRTGTQCTWGNKRKLRKIQHYELRSFRLFPQVLNFTQLSFAWLLLLACLYLSLSLTSDSVIILRGIFSISASAFTTHRSSFTLPSLSPNASNS